MIIDVVVGLQYGDEAKGKIVCSLIEKSNYNYVCRASGGGNCGHTIYRDGQKFVTHFIPSGLVFGIKSLIGSGCVIHPKSFLQEIEGLEKQGVNTLGLIKISHNAHIITDEHIQEDINGDKIGSTKTGIMPVYRDKYQRCGTRAADCKELEEYVCDQYQTLIWQKRILIEGAQGFFLCPDHGDYPFVTSSPPTSSYALHSLELCPQDLGDVYGAAKCYETYVGTKDFQPKESIFDEIGIAGNEFGATTGRKRQVNYLNIDNLQRTTRVNGVTQLIVSKMDVLESLNQWKAIIKGKVCDLVTKDTFIDVLRSSVQSQCDVIFSSSPYGI